MPAARIAAVIKPGQDLDTVDVPDVRPSAALRHEEQQQQQQQHLEQQLLAAA
eukprot:CAMPEP_0170141268 /NCGR_PEP_ID=MMETSP0033_2-20121228/6895_1 /TAXON_ID=195969 /ORGANISM="Dolichomastix tenuilepis, Strain CCMP3274" /LENGTH=51 /DNA_ID=CAMNT_0010377525 /DNA_START=95 /DNA_END=247 /DNA_ORIENTATION=+